MASLGAFGPTIALFASAAILGTMHFVSYLEGQPLAGTTWQILHADVRGVLYGVIVLRRGSIGPAVALEAAWDASVLFSVEMFLDMPSEALGVPQTHVPLSLFALLDALVGLHMFRA